MAQQDVIVAVEGAGKVGLKAALMELIKDGGALDLEAKELSSQNVVLGAVVGAIVPVAKQLISGVAAKLG
jgi:hypothetical protein